MNRLGLLLLGVSLMVTGCGQPTTPGTSKLGASLTATPSSDSEPGQPPSRATSRPEPPVVPTPPEDPLAAAARKLEPLQVRVELVKSEPAGDKNEAAIHEWAILARVSAAEVKLPPGMVIAGERSKEPGWAVVRVRLQFDFDKSADDRTFDQQGVMIPKPGVRQLQMHVHCQSEGERPALSKGSSGHDIQAKPGTTPMTLTLTSWLSPELDVPGATNFPRGGTASLEVTRGPLDTLVEPVCKGPETFEAPKELELMRVNGKAVRLKIVR
jgi:hypothetical protein